MSIAPSIPGVAQKRLPSTVLLYGLAGLLLGLGKLYLILPALDGSVRKIALVSSVISLTTSTIISCVILALIAWALHAVARELPSCSALATDRALSIGYGVLILGQIVTYVLTIELLLPGVYAAIDSGASLPEVFASRQWSSVTAAVGTISATLAAITLTFVLKRRFHASTRDALLLGACALVGLGASLFHPLP